MSFGNETRPFEDRIREVILEVSGAHLDRIVPEARFAEDLEFDSIDFVELWLGLEEEFGTEIHDSEIEKLQTVQDVIHFIEKRIEARSAR